MEEAQALLGTDDAFTRGWSEFDILSRLQKTSGTKAELIAFKQGEVRAWTQEEKELIWQDMLALNQIIRKEGYRLPLPEEVVLVKSTMKDEGDAGGYTQANWIALSAGWIKRASEKGRRTLLLHELSHILTRNSVDYKCDLYAALGFSIAPGGMEYPAELLKTRISNPDIAAYDSYGPFTVKGGKVEQCAMYLYADRPYARGAFFEYVKVAFVPYGPDMKAKRDADGKLIVYGMEDIEDFAQRVGKNTDYIIHPEEILAENFVLAFLDTPGVPTPELKDRVRKVLLYK
ncbi:hypothetical protein EVA_11308 [gut metagenome]|uniref:Uncharacterized protein n=1 Tax=gut metagenome TaxID=749906 RepID=J9GLH5_9ZZZZ